MVIAVDLIQAKLDMAKKYGATHVINSSEVKNVKAALLELTDVWCEWVYRLYWAGGRRQHADGGDSKKRYCS